MQYDELVKQTRRSDFEGILTVLSGLRRVPVYTAEDIAYNNALGDVFDHILENNKNNLYQHTVYCGNWVRDKLTGGQNEFI